jgi:FMN phosphatase YigB (HAD superfamily)
MRLKGDNVFWDLDGVLRDIHGNFNGGSIHSWDVRDSSGNGIVEYIDNNLSLLETAPTFKYIDIAMQFHPIHIVSAQPDHWRKYTSKWLDNYLPDAKVKYLLNTEDKLKYLESGRRILIEDYPYYSDYTHIILIDRPYNQNVVTQKRVHNNEELLTAIRGFLND